MFGKLFRLGPKYSLQKSLLIVCCSCIVVLSITISSHFLYNVLLRWQSQCANCPIDAIVQTGPLSTVFFAEVLDLSADCPQYSHQFDLSEAKTKLMNTNIFEEVHLKKIKPNILYIDYSLRKPVALLEDYTNVALDISGKCFPYTPFFSPTRLPGIYLGERKPGSAWEDTIDPQCLSLITQLLETLGTAQIQSIDLSRLNATSSGRREIIVTLRNHHLLRLNPNQLHQQLANYFLMSSILKNRKRCMIDLRIPEIAYMIGS